MRLGVRSYSLGELVDLLGGELVGSRDVVIRQVAPLESAGPEHIAFLGSDAYREALADTRAAAVILAPGVKRAGHACIIIANPYAYFVRVAALLNPEPEPVSSVHPMASIHPDAVVAGTAEIGAFVTVGRAALIGPRVRVGAGCRIGAHARIGDDSNLHANVSVYDYCEVGKRAVLNAGCVIGADGFGGAMAEGRWLKMPHIGRVIIGDDVEIGANTTVDRGAMADTVIEDGAKLDNQIQVGHNVHIGAHTSIAGCAGIAGSAQIGAHCVIGGGAIVLGHLRLADRVQISAGTVVTRSIDVPGRYSGIYPASEHRVWLKSAVRVRRLGESEAQRGKGPGRSTPLREEADDNANQ